MPTGTGEERETLKAHVTYTDLGNLRLRVNQPAKKDHNHLSLVSLPGEVKDLKTRDSQDVPTLLSEVVVSIV